MLTIGQFGWVENRQEARLYADTLRPGDDYWAKLRQADDGRDRFWYRALSLALRMTNNSRWVDADGRIRSYNQGQVGSCVGNGWAKHDSYREALDIYADGQLEAFQGMSCAEWSYYASRVEAGIVGKGDGSTGYGAAKASVKWGVFHYGKFNIDAYTETRCRQWGDGRGIPQEVIAEAKPHTFKEYIVCDTAEKVWLAAGFGLIIPFCSNQGFEGKRDNDGVIKPRGRWAHCMNGGAARRTLPSGQKVVLIDQSWGDNWTDGPYGVEDAPWGSFWIDLDVAGSMAAEGDTYVSIDYQGEVAAPTDPSFTQM